MKNHILTGEPHGLDFDIKNDEQIVCVCAYELGTKAGEQSHTTHSNWATDRIHNEIEKKSPFIFYLWKRIQKSIRKKVREELVARGTRR